MRWGRLYHGPALGAHGLTCNVVIEATKTLPLLTLSYPVQRWKTFFSSPSSWYWQCESVSLRKFKYWRSQRLTEHFIVTETHWIYRATSHMCLCSLRYAGTTRNFLLKFSFSFINFKQHYVVCGFGRLRSTDHSYASHTQYPPFPRKIAPISSTVLL